MKRLKKSFLGQSSLFSCIHIVSLKNEKKNQLWHSESFIIFLVKKTIQINKYCLSNGWLKLKVVYSESKLWLIKNGCQNTRYMHVLFYILKLPLQWVPCGVGVDRWPCNSRVSGSIPGTSNFKKLLIWMKIHTKPSFRWPCS